MMKIRKLWLVPGAVVTATVMAGLGGLLSQPASAASAPGPTLTVVGYGVVNESPPSSNPGPQQLQINFQEYASTAPGVLQLMHRDEAKARTQLEKAGVSASAITNLGTPGFNVQSSGGFQGNETLQVTFSNLNKLAKVLQASGVANDTNVQNVFVQPVNNSGPSPTSSAMMAGYQAAFANALQTAQQMAQADNLQLGQAVSVSEGGAASGGCNPMGGCSPVMGNPPAIGQNQELVTVTVTYDTNS